MVAMRNSESPAIVPPNDGIMELSFMISQGQFLALEEAARSAQMTVAQYLRRLVQCSLVPQSAGASERVQ
jgi:hypothetical protein